MQILLFSDFHGAMDMDALNLALSKLPPADATFTLGDISFSELASIKNLIPSTPIYGLCGNHDSPTVLDLVGIPNLHEKSIEICGVSFAGFEGSIRYKRGPYTMYSHAESMDIALSIPTADVLLSHDRAFIGGNPNTDAEFAKNPHEGLLGISSYLQKATPFLHIHGHIHKNANYSHDGIDTISLYGAALLTIDNRSVTDCLLLAEI